MSSTTLTPKSGLQPMWGLSKPDAGPLVCTAEGRRFDSRFRAALTEANGALQYTAAHAATERHAPLAAAKEAAISRYQRLQREATSDGVPPPEQAVRAALSAVERLQTEACELEQETRAGVSAWEACEGRLDAADRCLAELREWPDAAEPELTEQLTRARGEADSGRHHDACAIFDELDGQLAAVYTLFLGLKAAKEKYEQMVTRIGDLLPGCLPRDYVLLGTRADAIETARAEASAAEKVLDYFKACEAIAPAEELIAGYLAQHDVLAAEHREYGILAAAAAALPDLAHAQDYMQTAALREDIATLLNDSESAARAESFQDAARLAGAACARHGELVDKLNDLQARQAEFEREWPQLEDRMTELSSTQPHSDAASLQGMLDLRAEIDAAVREQDYRQAVDLLGPLKRCIEGLEPKEEEPLYLVEHGGQTYRGTAAELASLRASLVVTAKKRVLDPLVRHGRAHESQYHYLSRLAEDHWVAAATVYAFSAGGADLDTVDDAIKAHKAALLALRQAIAAQSADQQATYEAATEALNATGRAIEAYLLAVDAGHSGAVLTLEVVKCTAFAIAGSVGAVLLAPAGASTMAVMAANAASGAGFSALQTLAEEGVAPLVLGDGDAIDGEKLANKVMSDAIFGAAGAVLGKLATRNMDTVADVVMTRAGVRGAAARTVVQQSLEGGIGNAIQTALSSSRELDKITAEEFWTKVGIAFYSGAVAENIVGKLGQLPRHR